MLDADDLLDDRPEVLAVCGAESSGHVLPNEVSRSNKVSWYPSLFICFSHLLCDACLLHEQAGAFSRQAPARPGDRQVLARATAADHIHRGQRGTVQLCDVPHMEHIGESQFRDFNGKGFDLAGPQRPDAVADCRQREAPDPIKEAPHRQHQHIPVAMAGASARVVLLGLPMVKPVPCPMTLRTGMPR